MRSAFVGPTSLNTYLLRGGISASIVAVNTLLRALLARLVRFEKHTSRTSEEFWCGSLLEGTCLRPRVWPQLHI
jgi:hypothetical protein